MNYLQIVPTQEHRTNPRTSDGLWSIVDYTGRKSKTQEEAHNLKMFCLENGYAWEKVREVSKSTYTISTYEIKGIKAFYETFPQYLR